MAPLAQRVVAFVAVVLLTSAGQALPLGADEGALTPDGDCMTAPSACPPQSAQQGQPPGPGQNLLENLRPYLDRPTYALLVSIVTPVDALLPADPIPARPASPEVDAQVRANAMIKAGGSSVHAHAHAQAHHGGAPAPGNASGRVPCGAAGCPDLVVDSSTMNLGSLELESFSQTDCAVVENATQAGERRLLRFTFTTPNVGDGDLIAGAPADHPAWFIWGVCHGHYHFLEYADYRLWTPSGYVHWLAARAARPDETPAEILADRPDLAAGFVAGHKQGFCAMDVRPYLLTYASEYQSCEHNQGIRKGWADEYGAGLDGQWIDVTGMAAGAYVLEAEVNPERLFVELDYANNSGAMFVIIPA